MNQLLVAIIGAVVGVAGALIGIDLQRAAQEREVVIEETAPGEEAGPETIAPVEEGVPPVPLPDGVEIARVVPAERPGDGDETADNADAGADADLEVAASDAAQDTPITDDGAPETDAEGADTAATEEVVAEAPVLLLIIGQVRDRETFMARYAAELPALYETFGGTGLAAGEGVEALEGLAGFETYLVSRWPSREAALAFWESEAHEALRQARIDEAWGDFDTLLLPAGRVEATEAGEPPADPGDGPDASEGATETLEETVEDAADGAAEVIDE